MDKEANPETPSPLSNHITAAVNEDSPRKSTPTATAGGGGDRLKRDEWSEGAVSCLLEAYEAKWILRNRAKLKGQDWEDVAKYVSSRSNYTKSSKTQTQCKNKIESMKKRYRSESAAADASSWPLFPRLDLLLRGSAPPLHALLPPPPAPQPASAPLVVVETATLPPPPPIAPPAMATLPLGIAQQNSHGSNGVDRVAKEDGGGTKLSEDKNHPLIETDSSTPAALYSDEDKTTKWRSLKTTRATEKKKKRRRREVAESIRWLAEVVVQSEQARMETMRELEKMRTEMEAKRAEMDLKRTEIIANTQLEIARLFAAGVGKGIDSSLRIGRS